jgi:hypothetical protein
MSRSSTRAWIVVDNQDAPWVAGEVAQLHIPLGDHDLEGRVGQRDHTGTVCALPSLR